MANANAIGEKLKDLGLRHGEKLGVAIASMIFFVCVGMAATKPTIATSPEQIKKAAQQSESNLNRPEKRETILERLAEKGIKDSDFAKVVEEQVKTALVPDNYKAAREWVTPEPGAGLIRDMPTLIAVTELYAYPGRGGLLVYELDKEGNRVPDLDEGKDQAKPRTARRKRRPPPGGMGGMMGGGARKKARKSRADIEREAKEEADRKERLLKNKLIGSDKPDEEAETKDEKEKDTGPEPAGKEIVKGYRWVAITGVLDHAKLVANYREALKNPAIAHPHYRRLDLQRQTYQNDGTWTKWESVSSEENYKVLDNLPETEEELTPPTVRPDNLVDPLPFLKAGLWEKVHIASLVPKEKKEMPKPAAGGRGGMRGGMMGGGMMGPGMMGGGMMAEAGRDDMRKAMGNMGNQPRMGGMMGMGMMGGGSSESAGNYWRTDAKKVMIRAFDFTAQEDMTYRYRVRIVVWNPNKGREDVNAGVDTTSDELRGPWSQETDQVTMPPDVMPYSIGSLPPSPTNDIKVRFQVIRFHPADGVTVTHNFEASPGEIIGEPKTADIPASDGSGKKPKTIDFNSRQIVLDVFANKKSGGYQQLPPGFVGPPIVRPVLALVLRPDGTVVAHSEVDDESNDVRKDMYNNYKHELSLSSKKREPGMGGMMGMGGMGGRMMGGGMMGGGMMGGERTKLPLCSLRIDASHCQSQLIAPTLTSPWGFFIAWRCGAPGETAA